MTGDEKAKVQAAIDMLDEMTDGKVFDNIYAVRELLQTLVPPPASVPYDDIVDLYHKFCPSLPKVARLTDARRAFIRSRWQESRDYQSLQAWEQLFMRIERSDWLSGRNDRGWRADFEWLVRPSNFVKIIEGRYDNRGLPQPRVRVEQDAYLEHIMRPLRG